MMTPQQSSGTSPTTSTSFPLLGFRQRLRLRWTWSSVTKIRKKQAKAAKRLELLQEEVRHQLLLQKELEQREYQLLHRMQELSPPEKLPQEISPPEDLRIHSPLLD